jgi:hypothetical protein
MSLPVTAPITLADVQAKLLLAVTANEAGDFNAAISYCRSAKLLLAGLPTRTASDGKELELLGTQLETLFNELRQAGGQSQAILTSRVQWSNANQVGETD